MYYKMNSQTEYIMHNVWCTLHQQVSIFNVSERLSASVIFIVTYLPTIPLFFLNKYWLKLTCIQKGKINPMHARKGPITDRTPQQIPTGVRLDPIFHFFPLSQYHFHSHTVN